MDILGTDITFTIGGARDRGEPEMYCVHSVRLSQIQKRCDTVFQRIAAEYELQRNAATETLLTRCDIVFQRIAAEYELQRNAATETLLTCHKTLSF